MASPLVDFRWWKCPDGYRVEDAPPRDERTAVVVHPLGIEIMEDLTKPHLTWPPARRIVPKSSKRSRRQYRLDDLLFITFAKNVKSEASALAFVADHGLLTAKEYEPTHWNWQHSPYVCDSLDVLLANAKALGRFYKTAKRGPGRVGSLVGLAGKTLSQSVRTSLFKDPSTGVPKLRFSITSPLTALWLQAAESVSMGDELRECLLCGNWFLAGPGKDRRAGSDFCSADHQVTYNSLKRRKK